MAAVVATVVLSPLSAWADIDLLNSDPLIEAAREDDIKVGENLLNRKHNVDVREKNGRTPLSISASRGNEDFVELLFRHRARVNSVDKFGNTPLYYAAAGNHAGVVELLLEGRANVNIRNRRGLTALMIAASEGNLETVQTLLEGNSDATLTDFTGRTAWEWAQRGNRNHVLRYLKSVGIER